MEWRVDHYQQRYHWDCGLSCCIMVLSDQPRNQLLDNFTKVTGTQLSHLIHNKHCQVLARFSREFEKKKKLSKWAEIISRLPTKNLIKNFFVGVKCSVAEPPLFWAALAIAVRGAGADSGSDQIEIGSAPATGKKGGSGSIH